MVGRVLTGNGITRYGDGLTTLIGVEELSDSERDALLELCHQRQDHLLLVIQGVHGGAPGQ
jgi:hypothetical protein